MDANTGTKPSGSMKIAWTVVFLLIPVAMLNYLDRQMLASMKSSVVGDLADIGSDAQWGMVLAVFKWTYAFLSPIGGLVADRFGKKRVVIASLIVWSIVTALTGAVTDYQQLLMTRALMGISEAFYIPAALALIAEMHLGPTRSRAIGMHQVGIYAGVILGGFSGYAADAESIGWRWAFYICGGIGVAYALPLMFALPNRVNKPSSDKGRGDFNGWSTVAELLSNRSFQLLVLYFTFPAIAGWVIRDWMPSILKKEFGIGQGAAGVSATLFWQSAAIFGAFLGGWLADKWTNKTIRGRIFISAIGMSLIVPALLGVGYSPQTGHLWVAIAFLILFGLGWGFFDCNNMPILCQIARPELRATGYGIMNMVSISVGGLADWGFGELKDKQIPLFYIFSFIALMAVLSIGLVLLIKPKNFESESIE
jgi:MFS transporter, Spinster family, sphingosine-1-phosphate transporter